MTGYTPVALFRLHASQRASRMVELARCSTDWTSFGVDPPRRGSPLEVRWPPTPFQPRRLVPRTSDRPTKIREDRNRPPHPQRRLSCSGIFKMGITRLLDPQASKLRLEINYRPTRDQQAVPDEKHEDGNSPPTAFYREAGRPLDKL